MHSGMYSNFTTTSIMVGFDSSVPTFHTEAMTTVKEPAEDSGRYQDTM